MTSEERQKGLDDHESLKARKAVAQTTSFDYGASVITYWHDVDDPAGESWRIEHKLSKSITLFYAFADRVAWSSALSDLGQGDV